MRTIKPRLQAETFFRETLFQHPHQLVAALDRIPAPVIAVAFDDFCASHPANERKMPELLASIVPAGCGDFECTVDIPGQRWFLVSAADLHPVLDPVMSLLRRIGLLRFARVYLIRAPRQLMAHWPAPGPSLDFSSVNSDLNHCAGHDSSPTPAIGHESRPENISGNTAKNVFRKLLQKLLLPLAFLKEPSNGLGSLKKRCHTGPHNGPSHNLIQ